MGRGNRRDLLSKPDRMKWRRWECEELGLAGWVWEVSWGLESGAEGRVMKETSWWGGILGLRRNLVPKRLLVIQNDNPS